MMARRIDREGPIHRSIYAYLTKVLPKEAIIHHSPNEGNRGGLKGRIDGKRRKEMGVHAGFFDFIIVINQYVYFIEVKPPKGSLHKSQREFRDKLNYQSIPWAVCRSIDDAAAFLRQEGLIR